PIGRPDGPRSVRVPPDSEVPSPRPPRMAAVPSKVPPVPAASDVPDASERPLPSSFRASALHTPAPITLTSSRTKAVQRSFEPPRAPPSLAGTTPGGPPVEDPSWGNSTPVDGAPCESASDDPAPACPAASDTTSGGRTAAVPAPSDPAPAESAPEAP